MNPAIAEEGLDYSNAFAKTYSSNDDNASSRQPISKEDIRKVQSLRRDIDDEMRWLIALISDTGMRLGEAAGLLKEDIKLNDCIPLVGLRPDLWGCLKTKDSQKRTHVFGQRGPYGPLNSFWRLTMIVSLPSSPRLLK